MRRAAKILIVGTADTKADELQFIKRCCAAAGGAATTDVGVPGTPSLVTGQSNARAAALPRSALDAALRVVDGRA